MDVFLIFKNFFKLENGTLTNIFSLIKLSKSIKELCGKFHTRWFHTITRPSEKNERFIPFPYLKNLHAPSYSPAKRRIFSKNFHACV